MLIVTKAWFSAIDLRGWSGFTCPWVLSGGLRGTPPGCPRPEAAIPLLCESGLRKPKSESLILC
jgi:hypothetical protein